jgi:hypothetical protein
VRGLRVRLRGGGPTRRSSGMSPGEAPHDNRRLLARIARNLAAAEEHLAALAPYTPHAALHEGEVRAIRRQIVAFSVPGPASPGGPEPRG